MSGTNNPPRVVVNHSVGRALNCDGRHLEVVKTESTGGDLAIELATDAGTLYVTEENIDDATIRGILRFGLKERARGEEAGVLAYQYQLARLLGVSSDHAVASLADSVRRLESRLARLEAGSRS
jgi:hypothetical protein